jgi:hypothetical protein
MSVVTCKRCDIYIDTDYDVEGEFIDDFYLCKLCVEDLNGIAFEEREARNVRGHAALFETIGEIND